MAKLGFGLIGSGFMGRAHAIALHAVGAVFDEVEAPGCVCLADQEVTRASRAARELGFDRSTADWRSLLTDPDIDVIDICTPNHLHFDMALAALEAGKHVYCEKPLAVDVAQAAQLAGVAGPSPVVDRDGPHHTTQPFIPTPRPNVASGGNRQAPAFFGRHFEG